MQNRKWFFLTLISCGLLLLQNHNSFSAALKVKVGQTAPDFTLQSLDGELISLSNYLGKKPVHMFFWATWCPSCRAELMTLASMQENYQKENVQLLAINVGLRESLDRVQSFISKTGLHCPVLFDANSKVSSQLYGTFAIPANIVVDTNGIIQYNEVQLPTDFDKILMKKPKSKK